MVDDITVSAVASVLYFVFTLISLCVMFTQYQLVSYSSREGVRCWMIWDIIYGLILIALGATNLGLEIDYLD